MADTLTQSFMPQQTEVSSLPFSHPLAETNSSPMKVKLLTAGFTSGGSNPLWGNWALAIGLTMLLFVTDEAL
jgi:hypothetical protein